MNLAITIISCLISIASIASDFRIKLEVEMVDHSTTEGITISVIEQGEQVMSEKLGEDGKSKLKLDEGKLFEVWVYKAGYIPHVIHNVHNEGAGKFKITLYKAKTTQTIDFSNYIMANRSFDEVKKMQIPAEYLADGVNVTSENEISKEEAAALKSIQKLGKHQEKTQKKIDKLLKKQNKAENEIAEISAAIANGSTDKTQGEEQKLKLQKAVVDYQSKVDKLAY